MSRVLVRVPKSLVVWLAIIGASVAVFVVTLILVSPVLAKVGPVSFRDIAGVSNTEQIKLAPLDERSYIYDNANNLLAVLRADQNRQVVTLDKISKWAQDAVVSAEDKNFYDHHGFDLRGAFRAAAVDITGGGVSQGGSTITQQVIKNSNYGSAQKKLRRKIQEAMLANRLEEQLAAEGRASGDPLYAKHTILTRYLNTVYLGNGAYGLEAGAETYFNGKNAVDLTLGEAAMLAAVIPSPNEYDPTNNPEKAKERRGFVLERMFEDGKITAAQMEEAKAAPVPEKVLILPSFVGGASDYFSDTVKQLLLDDPQLGDTEQERYNKVFGGGLKITTTFDRHLQDLATNAVNDTIPDQPPFTAAMSAIDSQTGAVRAFVSGKNFNFQEKQYNLATQANRSVGSAFKAISLTAHLSNGGSPRDTVDGISPCILGAERTARNPQRFSNAEGAGGGIMTVEGATVGSVNCAYLHLAEGIGPDKIQNMAKLMGFGEATGHVPQTDPGCPCPSITLGAVNASTLDMAAAMSTLAAEGVHHKTYFVEKIEDRDGKVVFQHDDPGNPVVDRNVALTVRQIMGQVISSGTGTAAILANGREASGKTGTDDNFRNAAFIGFTKHFSVAVWMGDPDRNDTSMRNVGGITVFGGTYPAMIFKAFMDPASEAIPVEEDSYERPNLGAFPAPKKVGYFSTNADKPPDSSSSSSSTNPPPPPPTQPNTTVPPSSQAVTTEPPKTEPPTTTTTTSPPTTVTTSPPTTTTSPPTTTTTTSPPTTT